MKRGPIAILGGGAWGTMLAQLASLNHAQVPLWIRDAGLREEISSTRTHPRALPGLKLSDRIRPSGDLEAVVREAELLVVAVPTLAFREVARQLGDLVEGDQLLVSAAKGLEEGTGARMSEILMEETCARLVGALGGPAYAEELAAGSPGAAVIGSRFESVVTRVQERLGSEQLRIYGNADLLGVELGGALATVMTLAVGMAHGLELGNGIKAVVLGRGKEEISRLGVALGAQAATFSGLSALGDMIASALSAGSRDHRLGELLARGSSLAAALEQVGHAESVSTTRVALGLAARARVEAPLTGAMAKVLFEGIPPRKIIPQLMKRRAVYEG